MNRRQARAAGALLALSLALLYAVPGIALPDDENQQFVISAGPSQLLLDEGIVVLFGTEDEPARVTQGSRVLEGDEIRIEREGETIRRVTATGAPASFRQQLKVDEDPVRIRGNTLVYDEQAQRLTVDGNGVIEQAGLRASNAHFDYDLATGNIDAPRSEDGEKFQMIIPPAARE